MFSRIKNIIMQQCDIKDIKPGLVLRYFLYLCAVILSCHLISIPAHSSEKYSTQQSSTTYQDEYTYANYQDVSIEHAYLDLAVNFEQHIIEGFVDLTLNIHKENTDELILDTRDLTIQSVLINTNNQWVNAKYQLGQTDEILGAKLIVNLTNSFNKQVQKVRVYYQSASHASGLQWLTAEQTASKNQPFMYSQNQPVHARSWIPIQDTPSVRMTYKARIRSDKNVLAVMSANNDPNTPKDGDYSFTMPQAIPAYLIALAVGDLHFQAMSDMTGVYAELPLLDKAANEFNNTQAMIDVTEKLFGGYRWGRYDLLILPPSFPYGGMENPRLSFITPTVIAGDKSLVNLIAHELAHSWSGNLVTNETWRDLWLNEGVTSYIENRIMEEIFGESRALMEQSLSIQHLQHQLTQLPANETILYVDLGGKNPDEAFTSIPYIKGQLFFMYLENAYGRAVFDKFLVQYFNDHAFKSVSSDSFMTYMEANLLNKHPDKVSKKKVVEWIFQQGLPTDTLKPTSNKFRLVDAQSHLLLNAQIKVNQLVTSNWTVHEWLYFINNLPRDLSIDEMITLDEHFDFTNSTNDEISHVWYLLALSNNYRVIMPKLEQYLLHIGRRKLIIPLYKALVKSESGFNFATKVYTQAKPFYHQLARNSVEMVLNEAKLKY